MKRILLFIALVFTAINVKAGQLGYELRHYMTGEVLSFKLDADQRSILSINLNHGDSSNGWILNEGFKLFRIRAKIDNRRYDCNVDVVKPAVVDISGERFYMSGIELRQPQYNCVITVTYKSKNGVYFSV